MTSRQRNYILLYILLCSFFAVHLSAAERILVVAPHPDDEVISLGGWLADRIASGAEAWAVFMTDGEAFPKAVRQNRLSRWPIIRAPAFLHLGKLRRNEGRRSLDILGIPAERRFFLGYPTNMLWKLFHFPASPDPVRSKATKQRFGIAEWPVGEEKTHPFTYSAWAADIDAILSKVRPDIVLVPVPFDTNTDHQTVTRMVAQRLKASRLRPALMGYLVHIVSRHRYPRPLGYHPNAVLTVPAGFPPPTIHIPSENGMAVKERALRAHKTQLNLKDGFLLGFLRKNEIFWPLDLETLSTAPQEEIRMEGQETLESETISR